MGIKGLHHYICTQIPHAQIEIDLIEEISRWKSEHGKNPTIIIDIKEFSQVVVQRDETGLFCGGRHQLYISFIRKFLTKLQSTGVHLLFFAPGCKLNDAPQIFIPKREEEYLKYINLLDRIDQNVPIRRIIQQKNRRVDDIRATHSVEFNIIKVCKQFGDVYFNYARHNQEIAQYANKHNNDILAIIAGDTDFLVFEGDWDYWPAIQINLKECSGVRVRRKTVWSELDVTPQQLQLVGALAGSFYLPPSVGLLKEFYTKHVYRTEKFSKIPDLAAYVRKIPQTPTADSGRVTFDLDRVAKDVFGDDYCEEQMNTIENGLTVYNLNFRIPMVKNSFHRQLKRHDRFLYKLLTDDIYNIRDIMFIDYRNYRSRTYAELLMPLLQRLMGHMFSEQRNTGFTRKICMKFSHEDPFEIVDETPCFPPADLQIPFEKSYLDHNKNDKKKWQLLLWMLAIDDELLADIKKLPTHFVTPVIALIYLVEQDELTVKEADAFLLTEYDVRAFKMPRIVKYATILNGRCVRIAHLYTKIYEVICGCLTAVGLPFSDLIKFDGGHFHNYMESFEQSAQMHVDMIKPIEAYRLFANDK